MTKRLICTALLALTTGIAGPSGCASTTSVQAPVASAARIDTARVLPRDIHWFRNSAEYRANVLQTYRAAAARVTELSRSRAPGTWAVILDVDETSLDNSEHQRRMALTGQSYSDSVWNRWVRERAAPAVPGAVEFTNTVHQLGGRVAFVSNRDDVVCEDTRVNLKAVGFVADTVLCRVNRVSDKTARFEAVAQGTQILAFIGDNIQDFPGLTQAVRENYPNGFHLFGDRFFILPNPMYGSWEANARN